MYIYIYVQLLFCEMLIVLCQQGIQDPQGAANGFPIAVGISNEGRDTDGRKLEAARSFPMHGESQAQPHAGAHFDL